ALVPLAACWGHFREWYVGGLERRAAELGDRVRVRLALWAGAAAAAALLLAVGMGRPLLAIPPALVLLLVPRRRLAARVADRERRLRAQFADAIVAVASLVRTGQPLATALDVVARQAPAPSGEFLRAAARDLAGGLPLAVALGSMRQRLRIDSVSL